MAQFTNQAQLRYGNSIANSNIAVGELLEVLSASKTAVRKTYGQNDTVTYVITIVNAGATALSGITITDNLGAYTFGEGTLVPLTYIADTVKYYVNGVLQTAPVVTGAPSLVISGLTVPANGDITVVYEAEVNALAPMDAAGTITNTAVVTGGGITPITVTETIGTGRFGAWLENVQDWGISRNRYWGTPLNIWQCEDCGEMMSIGSIEELKEKSDNCPDNIELHRPYVDAVTCKCPKCQGTMKRVPEVIDCWFDSGSMPFAQHHYPFENKELFEQQFPAKFISEAVDQTRGWFYSLLAISTLLFNKAPYENVIVLGHVQDADGQKMSKSKGNAVDPFDALQKHGADAIRWYFYENSAPWVPNRFKDEWVSEGQRKFMGTFWNTYAFFVLYANIDNFDATKYQLEYDKLSVMDKWLLSKLNSLVKFVDTNLENYKITETARALEDFTDELSNWYVRRSRERFWAKGMEQDKINAYMTLYTTLVTLAKISAPMVPFMTESIYRNLVCSIDKNAPISIHLCDFPKVNEQFIDKKLEETMDDVLDAVVIGRACRNSTNIKNRQPIGKMFIKADWKLDEFYTAIIADELNVKEVEYTDDVRAFTSYSFKPQMKTLGPKYGKLLNAIRTALTEVDGNATMDKLNESGSFELNVEGQAIELSKDDVLIEMTQKEGFVASSDKGITVVLDTNLTPELIEEGFVREVISKVQTMRKDAGFEVMDKINLYVSGNDKIADIVNKNAAQVKTVVLAQDIITGKTAGFEKEWDINGEKVTLAVEKLA